MNKLNASFLATVLALLLLSACSGGSKVVLPKPDLSTQALPLPGAPNTSTVSPHTINPIQPGAIPNGHRAHVFARKANSGTSYEPDSYIPVSSVFEINLTAPHERSKVRITVAPNSTRFPISCSWNTENTLVTCSSSIIPLAASTLYTVKVEEYTRLNAKVSTWQEVGLAYFRTTSSTLSFNPY